MNQTPLFPLGNALFPDGVLHLRIFEVRYLNLIKRCIAENIVFGVVMLRQGSEVRTPEGEEVLGEFGTMAHIEDWEQPMAGLYQIRCRGGEHFRLLDAAQGQYGLWAGQTQALAADPVVEIPAALQPCADGLGKFIARLQRQGMPQTAMPISPPYRLDECGWVANRWAELLPLPPARKLELLGLENPLARLQAIDTVLQQHGVLDGL